MARSRVGHQGPHFELHRDLCNLLFATFEGEHQRNPVTHLEWCLDAGEHHVQPVGLDDTPRGTALLAVDSVGAGVREKVLIVMEGRAAGEALGRKGAPVDAAIIGIIDAVDVQE